MIRTNRSLGLSCWEQTAEFDGERKGKEKDMHFYAINDAGMRPVKCMSFSYLHTL